MALQLAKLLKRKAASCCRKIQHLFDEAATDFRPFPDLHAPRRPPPQQITGPKRFTASTLPPTPKLPTRLPPPPVPLPAKPIAVPCLPASSAVHSSPDQDSCFVGDQAGCASTALSQSVAPSGSPLLDSVSCSSSTSSSSECCSSCDPWEAMAAAVAANQAHRAQVAELGSSCSPSVSSSSSTWLCECCSSFEPPEALAAVVPATQAHRAQMAELSSSCSHSIHSSSSTWLCECCSSCEPREALAAGVPATQAQRGQMGQLSRLFSHARSTTSSISPSRTDASATCSCQPSDPTEATCSNSSAAPSPYAISPLRCRGTSWPDEPVGMPWYFTQPPAQAPPILPNSLSLERSMYGNGPRRVRPVVVPREDCQLLAFWERAGCTALPSTPKWTKGLAVRSAASGAPNTCASSCTDVAELQFDLDLDEQPAVASPVPAAVPVSPEAAERVPEDTLIGAHYPSGRPFASAAGWDPLARQQVVQLLAANPVTAQLLIDAAQKREGMLAHAGAVKLQLRARPVHKAPTPSLWGTFMGAIAEKAQMRVVKGRDGSPRIAAIHSTYRRAPIMHRLPCRAKRALFV